MADKSVTTVEVADVVAIDNERVLTTKKEQRAWYMYDVANAAWFYGAVDFVSVFVVDQASIVAKEEWCVDNFGLSPDDNVTAWDDCLESGWAVDFDTKGTCVNGDGITNSSCVEDGGSWKADWITEAGLINMWGLEMNFAATFTTATTLSVIIQLLLQIGCGSIGDYAYFRKPMFTACNLITVVAISLMFLGEDPSTFSFVAAMSVIATAFLTFGTNLYNAWLPVLVEYHPIVDDAEKELKGSDPVAFFQLRNLVTAEVSKWGTVCGFIGVVVFLGSTAGMFEALAPSLGDNLTLRIVCLIAAGWTLVFSLVTTFGIRTRKGLEIPEGKLSKLACVSEKRIYETFSEARKFKNLMIYLAAYFVYSDGLSTMAGAAAVFASVELGLGLTSLIIAYLLSAIGAIISALVSVYLAKKFKIAPKTILIGSLMVLGCIPFYGLFALTSEIEFYVIVLLYGLMNGAAIVFGRSIFSSIIPLGHEAHFFSLYSLTDKGTAWLGPLLLTIVSTQTGSFRSSFSVLAGFFIVGIFILAFFDHEKANEERNEYQVNELGKKSSDSKDVGMGKVNTF